MSNFRRVLPVICVAAVIAWNSAHASVIVIDGVEHDETAFVDDVTLDSGVFTPHLAPTPEDGLIGGDVLTAANCLIDSAGCSFTAYFTDNVAVNGSGDDLVLYAVGGTGGERFDITINGLTLTNQSASWTGVYAGAYTLLAYYVNLDLFGLAAGAAINSFTVMTGAGGLNPEDFVAFAALNSETMLVNPVPGAVWLFGSALVAGGFLRRRKQKAC